MAIRIKGLLVDVTRERNIRVVWFEDTLENIYKLLDVDLIDVAVRKCGKYHHDFIVDDEGLLKGNAIPSVFDSESKPSLVGNVLIVNGNEEGDFTSLTDEQISNLLSNHVMRIAIQKTEDEAELIEVIRGADYE